MTQGVARPSSLMLRRRDAGRERRRVLAAASDANGVGVCYRAKVPGSRNRGLVGVRVAAVQPCLRPGRGCRSARSGRTIRSLPDTTLGEAAVQELGNDHALATLADVTEEAAVERAIAAGVERFDHLDVLFSNAGISGAVAPIQDYPSDEFARTLAVHVLGAFHMLKHGAPHVRDGGSIIITSSVVGLMGFE